MAITRRLLQAGMLLSFGLACMAIAARAEIENTATATARYGETAVESEPAQVTVTVDEAVADVRLYKVITGVEDVNGNGVDDVGDIVSYGFTVINTGGLTLAEITLTDPQIGYAPAPFGPLAPGEEQTGLSASHTITADDLSAGGIENSALIVAQPVDRGDGTPRDAIEDISDAGDDAVETPALDGATDGDATNDPTVLRLEGIATLDVSKTLTGQETVFPTVLRATFELAVTNTGNVRQDGIGITDDLSAFLGPSAVVSADYPIEVEISGFDGATPNSGYDGLTDTRLLAGNPALDPGGEGHIVLSFVYSTAGGPAAGVNLAEAGSNQSGEPVTAEAAVASLDRDGDGVPDDLEHDGEDRDGDGISDPEDYDPTGYFYCEEDGRILSGGQITISGNGFTQTGTGTSGPIVILEDGTLGHYRFHVTAPGSYSLSASYPSTGVPSTATTSSGALDVTSLLPSNPGVLGSGETGGSGVLADYSAAANPFYTAFTFEAGDPFILNNNIPLMSCAGQYEVVAKKAADRATAVAGETVNYTVTFTNSSAAAFTASRLVDVMPAGIRYTPGTARIDGVAQEPAVAGNRLSWVADVGSGATVTLTYSARVLRNGAFGPRVNMAWLESGFGRMLSNRASASVRIEPEHVFDCSDVIGKVFDDRNRNGYQDGPGTLREPIIDDDSLFAGGKLSPAMKPQAEDRTEPGIAGVRLVTPDGKIITTDAFGRFSVPCAALPKSIGSNFMLKLDPRSLPTGYRVTTENPRVVRVTPGKMAKLNFGAALSEGIDIALTSGAFGQGGTALSAELDRGLDTLAVHLAKTPGFISLTYTLSRGEDPALARARIRKVEEALRGKMRGKGGRLEIGKTIRSVSQ